MSWARLAACAAVAGLAAAQPVSLRGAVAEERAAGASVQSFRPAEPPAAEPPLCWTAGDLAGRPEERAPRKGIRTFDLPPPEAGAEQAGGSGRGPVPAAPVPPEFQGSIRRVELAVKRRLLALTFDLCEQPGEVAGYDGAIVDYLRAHSVKATFFAGGKWLASHSERAMQLLADPLFEVGTHGWAHRNVRGLDAAGLATELMAPLRMYGTLRRRLAERQCLRPGTEGRIAAFSGPALFRFPYGACNAAALRAANRAGLLAIQWDVSAGDPVPAQSAAAIAVQVLRRVTPGSIVVAHANGRGVHTAEALPLLIPRLRSAGYEFVTVSELLAAGRPQRSPVCYDFHPGDTGRYDRLFLPRVARARNPSAQPPARRPKMFRQGTKHAG